MLTDYFYNRCYRAPVRASSSFSPSKLQMRSTERVPTPHNSHSMRFPVTAIIKSASFSEINVKRVYVCSLPPTMEFVLCYVMFLFQGNLLLFYNKTVPRDGKRDTKKDSLSRRKNYLRMFACAYRLSAFLFFLASSARYIIGRRIKIK